MVGGHDNLSGWPIWSSMSRLIDNGWREWHAVRQWTEVKKKHQKQNLSIST